MSVTENPLWRGLVALPPYPLGSHRFLLINQAAWKGASSAIEELAKYERTPLWGRSTGACVDGATPFLLRLDGQILDSPQTMPLQRLCDRGCFASALHVIDATLPASALANALSQRCEARMSDGQSVMLRYFDTRVLDALLEALTPEQLGQLVACAGAWWCADRAGYWVPLVVSPWPTRDTFAPPWQFSAGQERALLDASEADAVIDVLVRQNTQALLEVRFQNRHAVIRSLLARAKHWGLEDMPDVTAFCTLGLLRGDLFDQSEPWSSLLPEIKSGSLRFVDALRRGATDSE